MENEHFYETSRRMPKSLDECIAPYPTTENLYRWAGRLKNLGYVLCCILIVCGLFNIASVADSIRAASKDAVISALLPIIIQWAVSVFIVYCIYHVLAVLLEALATTVQCRVITTKVALLEANKKADTSSLDTSNTSNT